MKQLVLYFLFFVCAAFVLIQCARFFPTNKNLPATALPGSKTDSNKSKKSSKGSSNLTADRLRQQAQNKPAFNLYFTEQNFPLNMMKYVNHYQFLSYQYWSINENKMDTWQLFYNPYTNFMYTRLFGKNDSSLMANNPFDRKK